MTILGQGGWEPSHRGYCRSGGYVGEVSYNEAAILIRDKWVRMGGAGPMYPIVDRILSTVENSP